MADVAKLLKQDGTRKKIAINRYKKRQYIPDENILFESFKLNESICSQSEFIFGTAEQDVAEFQLVNYENITGEYLEIWLRVYEENSDKYEPVLLGYFRVTESKKDSNNNSIRKIVAMTDLDAPQNFINAFSYLAYTSKLKGFKEYIICPELLVYGGTKNIFSGPLSYATLSSTIQNVTLSQYIDGNNVIHNLDVTARAWERPQVGSSYKTNYNALYYISNPERINYLQSYVINKINSEVDSIITASGLNPPTSFRTKTKEYIYNYLQKLQSFFSLDVNTHAYLYYIPTEAYNSRYKSPFIDQIILNFNGITRTVTLFDMNNPFTSMEIYNTKNDPVKDYICVFNIDGLDMSTDEWIKKFRRDWYNLTGRITQNRNVSFPYAAPPSDLHQSALYPDERLFPADNLYPDGPEHSIFMDNIKKIWMDDEEDINKYNSLKLSFVDKNNKNHTLTRIFNKTSSDVEIKASRYDLPSNNRVLMTLGESIKSNVIKIQVDTGLSVTIEFLNDNDEVIATAMDGSGVYYKRVSGSNINYVSSYHYLTGTTVFESDDFIDVSKIRFIGTSTLTIANIRDHVKVFNELHIEQDVPGKTYVIDSSNMCLQRFQLDPGSIEYFADMLESKLKNLNYIDVSMTSRGLPNMLAGEGLEIVTNEGVFDTYIMRRTLSGINVLTDSIEAK